MFHYTDKGGYNAIVSQVTWRFIASQPPGKHPFGAYFTTLAPDTRNLANKLRIPKAKVAFFFAFADIGDLTPLPGNRGEYIFYSPDDYSVGRDRQEDHGETGL